MKEKEMTRGEPERECYFYNFGDNSNFEYRCPTAYGARCEFYDTFFGADSMDVETKEYINLKPDCSGCSEERKAGLEGRVE